MDDLAEMTPQEEIDELKEKVRLLLADRETLRNKVKELIVELSS